MAQRNKDWNEILREGHDNYATLIDDVNGDQTLMYLGKADRGTATSASAWQIRKVVTSGAVTSIQWANGSDNFENVWDNRASLSYS